MNILIVITKGEVGGAQMFVSTLAKNLHRQGHTVTVAYGEGNYLRDTLTPEGIALIHFPSLKRTVNPFTNLRFGWELRKLLATHRFDVVHFNSSNALMGVLGARLLRPRPKLVFTIHGLSVIDPNYAALKPIKWVFKLLFSLLLRLIDAPVFVSKTNLEYATQIGLVKSGTVIPNGVDTEGMRFLPRKEARGFLEEGLRLDLRSAYIIGSIGRLAYPKNYEFLIQTFPRIMQEIPDAIAIIIGEGPERRTYERLIAKKGLGEKIFLLGNIPDAYRYIKAFDLFVLPSEYEGMSMTLIEAMFAEVPILASHVGGTPELLGDPTQTHALNNRADFMAKLKTLTAKKSPAYTKEKRVYRSRFEGKAMTEAYIKIYG